MKRQGSRYNTEVKAQAVAIATGSTAAQAARELDLPYRTVARWVERYTSEIGNEQWQDDNGHVIARSTELILDGMDTLEEIGEQHKHLIALNAIRGTSIDKRQRDTATAQTPGVTVIIGVVPGVTVTDVTGN